MTHYDESPAESESHEELKKQDQASNRPVGEGHAALVSKMDNLSV